MYYKIVLCPLRPIVEITKGYFVKIVMFNRKKNDRVNPNYNPRVKLSVSVRDPRVK